jgi:Uma2 family endonuclease
MHMALESPRWTRADLARMPDADHKFEVIDGELLVSPAPRPAHDALVRVLWSLLATYCDRTGIAHVSGHMPVFVAGDSETIPDIVVRKPVVPPPEKWDDAPMPLLVVEVLSDATRQTDTIRKRQFYIESGIPEYWIVNGDARTVRVISSDGDRVEGRTLRWRPSTTLDALSIDLPSLFTEALGRA